MNAQLEFAVTAQPWVPHEYQSKAVSFCLSQGAGGLFIEAGLGKTACILAVLKILKAKKLMKSALIVAPLRVCYSVWPREVEKWLDFNELTYEILHGPKKDVAVKRKADIYLLNPDGFEWFFKEKRTNADVLVYDESTGIKHTNTKRFKLLKPALNRFRRRYILTGTPAANGLMDLFGQVYVLDQGAALGRYITNYRANFFYATGFGGYEWKLLPGATQLIEEKIAPLVMQLSAKDYLQLPTLIENTVEVDLPAKALKFYKELEEEFLAELASGEIVTAATAATASMKLRQCVNGAVFYENAEGKRKWEAIHNAKLEACRDLVAELNGKPVLIAYEFTHDRERLLKLFGKDTPWLGGGVTPKRSQEIQRAWNAGELPILLGQPQSMGHGLNLQGSGNTIIWFSPSWNFELHSQTISRVHRQGQKASHVFVHTIVARGSIDELVQRTLLKKDYTQQALFAALKEYARGR